ncbi:hypothetical protein [Salinibacter altiplanensis]|uniref:hypothetical protein n=1 Tax=Salinibacter altiplanensis TaxID=1803181 RepID=UPI00131A5D3D|nr:hypothetical protein [Salinibacter altiplanensis]
MVHHPALVGPAAKREGQGDCERASTHEQQGVERPAAAEQLKEADRREDQAVIDPT